METGATFELMDEYCASIGKLAVRTLRLVNGNPDLDQVEIDEIKDQGFVFMQEENTWNGMLAFEIESAAMNLAINIPDGDRSGIRKAAVDRCYKKILFQKNRNK